MNYKKIITVITGGLLIIGLFLSGIISNQFTILKNGIISIELMYILLALPFLTMLFVFLRVFVGISINNIFLLTLFSSSFIITGIDKTIIFITCILCFGYSAKYILSNYQIHFASKTALLICLLSLVTLLILPIAIDASGINMELIGTTLIIFILITTVISEKYLSFKYSPSKLSEDLKSLLSIIIISMVCSFLLGAKISFLNISFDYIKDLLIEMPDLILFALVGNLVAGYYTGLRITELYKFRKLIFK